MNLDDFCSNEVPDFTPLGGNRPDCAVVMAAAVSLVEGQQQQQQQHPHPPPAQLHASLSSYDMPKGSFHDSEHSTSTSQSQERSTGDVLQPSLQKQKGKENGDREVVAEEKENANGSVNGDEEDFEKDADDASDDVDEEDDDKGKDVEETPLSDADEDQAFAGSPDVLPPDVLDAAMAFVCATVFICSATDIVPPPHGSVRGARLSCQLEVAREDSLDAPEDSLDVFRFGCECTYTRPIVSEGEKTTMPWRNYDNVSLKMVLPDSITSGGHFFLSTCNFLVVLDLRHSRLQSFEWMSLSHFPQLTTVYLPDTLHTVGEYFLSQCDSLKEVHLPNALHTVSYCFLYRCKSLVSIDLSNTQLLAAGNNFLSGCKNLKEVQLPDTLETVDDQFVYGCDSLVAIDLRNTKLHTTGSHFLSSCENLTEVHLPDILSSVGGCFLADCGKLSDEEIDRLKQGVTVTIAPDPYT